MKSLFFHRGKIQQGKPVFFSAPHYYATRYFLANLQVIAPEVTQDLYKIVEYYTENVHLEIVRQQTTANGKIPTEWSIIKASTSPECRTLTEKLLLWANKYNLMDGSSPNSLYMEIAIWAVGIYIEESSDQAKKERIERRRLFVEQEGHSEEEYRHYFEQDFVKPKISMVDAVFMDDEVEMSDEYDVNFPFVFTPTFLQCIDRTEDIAVATARYEDLLFYQRLLLNMMHEGKHDKDRALEMFSRRWSGWGWNPQIEEWSAFEKKMDDLYQEYKKLYRCRTEWFVKKRGYEISRAKRNLDHFEWLVRYQVLGWTMKQIADVYAEETGKIITEEAVRDALHSTAELVFIELRKNSTIHE